MRPTLSSTSVAIKTYRSLPSAQGIVPGPGERHRSRSSTFPSLRLLVSHIVVLDGSAISPSVGIVTTPSSFWTSSRCSYLLKLMMALGTRLRRAGRWRLGTHFTASLHLGTKATFFVYRMCSCPTKDRYCRPAQRLEFLWGVHRRFLSKGSTVGWLAKWETAIPLCGGLRNALGISSAVA